MKVVAGLDLSLSNATAVVVPETFMATGEPDWKQVSKSTFGLPAKDDAPESELIDRLIFIARGLTQFLKSRKVTHVWVENYSFGSKYGSERLGELGGTVKVWLKLNGLNVEPVPPARCRKVFLGKCPKGAKAMVFKIAKDIWSAVEKDDDSDALVVANFGLHELGLPCFTKMLSRAA